MGAGSPGPVTAAAPQMAAIPAVPAQTHLYGGFWIRFVAAFIDGLIVNIVCWPIVGILTSIGVLGSHAAINANDPAGLMVLMGSLMATIPVTIGIGWLYEAFTTSSQLQATLGKRILGLKVTDENGRPIGFGRATARHFSKFISAMILFIGYIMAGFTDKKRALHDMIAGTLVMKR